MYGLPRHLTYDLYVLLTLAMPRAEARLARPVVTALELAAGKLGPLEYYLLDRSDEKEGIRAYEEAACRIALTRLMKRSGRMG